MSDKIIRRGFKAFRRNIEKNSRRVQMIMNCKTCKYFYKDNDSGGEICHNKSVTPYDIVEEEHITYCSFWIPSWAREKD